MKTGSTLAFEQIEVGTQYSFEHEFTRTDERHFAEMTGDSSVVVMPGESVPIVHGMLAASFFSTLVDTYPGPNCLYISQTLQFRKALRYGDHVVVRGTVLEKSPSTRMITLRTEMLLREEVAIAGEAKVTLL